VFCSLLEGLSPLRLALGRRSKMHAVSLAVTGMGRQVSICTRGMFEVSEILYQVSKRTGEKSDAKTSYDPELLTGKDSSENQHLIVDLYYPIVESAQIGSFLPINSSALKQAHLRPRKTFHECMSSQIGQIASSQTIRVPQLNSLNLYGKFTRRLLCTMSDPVMVPVAHVPYLCFDGNSTFPTWYDSLGSTRILINTCKKLNKWRIQTSPMRTSSIK
jgi:hypothetical protein